MLGGGWALLFTLALLGVPGGRPRGLSGNWNRSQAEASVRSVGELGSPERGINTKAALSPFSSTLGEAHLNQPPPPATSSSQPDTSIHGSRNRPAPTPTVGWYYYLTLGILMMASSLCFCVFCCYKYRCSIRAWGLRFCPRLTEDLDHSWQLYLAESQCSRTRPRVRPHPRSPSARRSWSPGSPPAVYFHRSGASREGAVTLCPPSPGKRLVRTGPFSTRMGGEDLA